MALWRLRIDGGVRFAVGAPDDGPARLLPAGLDLAQLLAHGGPGLAGLDALATNEQAPADAVVLAPIDAQPVWAAGVTYLRSREARKEESSTGDFYDLVYDADRPELFFKALPGQVRGPGERVGVRRDSAWNVPEPELGVVIDADGAIAGFVLADDVSSRSIEGENPLYLPQAKVYEGSCALGPCIVPVDDLPAWESIEVALDISRDGVSVYRDIVLAAHMRRTPQELADWLFRALRFPEGVVLLSGTSIVPDAGFTLREGDEVAIAATGLGMLRTGVEDVGSAHRA